MTDPVSPPMTAPQTPPTLEGMAALNPEPAKQSTTAELVADLVIEGRAIASWLIAEQKDKMTSQEIADAIFSAPSVQTFTATLSRSDAVAHGVPAGVVRDYLAAVDALWSHRWEGRAPDDELGIRYASHAMTLEASRDSARMALDAALAPDDQAGAVGEQNLRPGLEEALRLSLDLSARRDADAGAREYGITLRNALSRHLQDARLAASGAAPAGDRPAQMRAICEALGFDPENHHNAAKCPYCTPERAAPAGGLPGELRQALAPIVSAVKIAGRWPHLAPADTASALDGLAWVDARGNKRTVTWGDLRRIARLAATGTGDAGRDHLAGVGKMVEAEAGEAIRISYINWRAEQTTPRILPQRILWGSNEWHPEPGWLLEAVDLDKVAARTYALRKILAWDIATPAAAPAQAPAAGGDLREALAAIRDEARLMVTAIAETDDLDPLKLWNRFEDLASRAERALAAPSADRGGTKCKAPGGACLYRGRCNTNRFGCHDSEAPAAPEVRR